MSTALADNELAVSYESGKGQKISMHFTTVFFCSGVSSLSCLMLTSDI